MTKISCGRTCSKRVEAREIPHTAPKTWEAADWREIEEQNRTHIPFRSWCKFFVSAGAPKLPHRARDPDQSAIKNEIAAGYCFLSDVSGGPSQPVLVGRDRRTGMFLPMRSLTRELELNGWRKQMAREISKCGYHGRVVLRSDQEPTLQDLMGEVTRLCGNLPTILEASLVGDSAIGWVIEHYADILNKCQVGKDGRTPYERLKGGTFMEFGSLVMLRVTDKPKVGCCRSDGTRAYLEHLVSR